MDTDRVILHKLQMVHNPLTNKVDICVDVTKYDGDQIRYTMHNVDPYQDKIVTISSNILSRTRNT